MITCESRMVQIEASGRKVLFGVSDPWDFGTQYGTGPFPGEIIATTNEAWLLKLPEPIRYQNTEFSYLVVTARHVGTSLSEVSKTSAVPVNMTPIPPEKAKTEDPDALFKAAAAWRAWHLIGGLREA